MVDLIKESTNNSEPLRFPDERKQVALIQEKMRKTGNFLGTEAVEWAIKKGLVIDGQITAAEIAPSLRCPENCRCPDSAELREKRIKNNEIPKIELRTTPDVYKKRMNYLHNKGVRHFMFVGGTLDHLPELGELINHALSLEGMKVSLFSDGIPQTTPDGSPSNLMISALKDAWMKKIANHISLDFPYGFSDIIPANSVLPPKKGRGIAFEGNPEYSRAFKSQYGVIYALNLIDANVRRVVLNTTISPHNLELIPVMYDQVKRLQDHAIENGKDTEVGMTVSGWIWRPHQARGDATEQSPSTAALQMADMNLSNEIFSNLLNEEYRRIDERKPRLLYNSSAYLNLFADPSYQERVVNQEVPYHNGSPEIYNITPTGDVWCDPQFPGPELKFINSLWGYRDRVYSKKYNIYSEFQNPKYPWFPNIVTT